MQHVDIKVLLNDASLIGTEVVVCGWIRTVRDSKNVVFYELNDGTSLKNLQVVFDKAEFCDIDTARSQNLGAAVQITGLLKESFGNQKVELGATKIVVLGDCPENYPLQKKRHTLEYLRTIAHLRGRTNTFSAVYRVRSVLSMAIHEFFQGRGFIYANTPIITGSDCEGAGEMFRVTTLDPKEDDYSKDFFGKKAGLTVSGQLEGEAMAMAMGKIYTFGPTFRAENSNTPRHAAEFWQIEPEVAFADLYDIIALARDMIKYIIKVTMERCPDEFDFFEKHYEQGLKQKLQNVVDSEFVILDYTKAVEILEKSGKKFDYPVGWGIDLQTEHERYIVDEVYKCPVFVVNYPKEIKSFYMKLNEDGKTVAASDLLVPGVGEIIGGSQREDNYDLLNKRIEELGMKMDDYWWYMDLRRFGSTPHAGFGLGLERMIMYITGMTNIRDVELFPRTTGNLEF